MQPTPRHVLPRGCGRRRESGRSTGVIFRKMRSFAEFWKTRPVLILSKTSQLYGKVTVLPFSTKAQPDNPMAYPVRSPIDEQQAWVICDYPTTVAVSRLGPPGRNVPRIAQDDFNRIVARLLGTLPRPEPRPDH